MFFVCVVLKLEIVLFFRLTGFANAVSFMNIGDEDISYVEKFVQNELEQLLLDRCVRLGTVLDDNEKECVFGIYAGNIKEFKFLRGERNQILGIAGILLNT